MTGDLAAPGVRAVLFGTGTHVDGSELPGLPSVDTTLDDLQRTLLEVCGMAPGHVTRVPARADAAEVVTAVEEAAGQGGGGPVLFCYAGHGLLGPRDELYLATHAGRSARHISRAVSYRTLRDLLGEAPHGSLVLLDCCFSGRAAAPPSDGGARQPFATARPRGSFLLTSASHYALSFAPEGERHTLFTGRLLRLLNEGDPAGPLWLTADRLHAALDREFADDGRVRPARRSEGTLGSLLLARNRAYRAGPAPAEATEPPTDLPCPYPGLEPFRAEDSAHFFGREELAARLIDMVEEAGDGDPVVLVGASGAGKSSLLRAGLLAGVEADPSSTRPALLLPAPGAHPMRTLAEAWAESTGREADEVRTELEAGRFPAPRHGGRACRLLVVDQFEETFTQCHDPGERAAFVAALAGGGAGSRPRVVLGLRANHYGNCLDHPLLERALARAQLTVPPLREGELRAAVESPAAAVGLTVEPGLGDRLLHDLREGRSADDADGGALPFLAHALREMWLRRSGSRLTLAGYQATGGIWHSVTTTTEALHRSLDEDGRRMMRELLLRLVYLPPDGGAAIVRHRVPLAALPDGAEEIRDRLVEDRLLTVDQDTAQIAHEALLRAWPRLRRWIEEDAATLLLRQQLSTAAEEWDASGRDAAFLYRGSRLHAARELAEQSVMPEREREFLAAGEELAERELHREQRRTRMLRRSLAAVAAALCLALVAAVLAVGQQRKAEAEQQVATARALLAEAGNLSASDPRASLRLGLAAHALKPSADARNTLFDTLATNPFRGVTELPTYMTAPVLSSDARTLATAGRRSGPLTLWDTGGGAAPRTPSARLSCRPPAERDTSMAFGGPEDRLLAANCGDEEVKVWDVAGLRKGTEPQHLTTLRAEGLPGGPNAVALSPDGKVLAAAGWSKYVGRGVLVLWSIEDPRHPRQLSVVKDTSDKHLVEKDRLAFSPDGRTLVCTGLHLRAWDVSDPGDPAVGSRVEGTNDALAFGPDGELLATGDDRSVKLIGVTSPGELKVLREGTAHTARVVALAFSPDGRRLATGGRDDSVVLWDVGDPQEMTDELRLTGHSYPPDALAFAADGRSLVSVSPIAEEVIRWDMADTQQLEILGRIPQGKDLALAPSGTLLAAAFNDRIRLWDLSDPDEPRSVADLPNPRQDDDLGLGDVLADMAFSADGTLLASIDHDRRVTLWDVTDPAEPRVTGTLRGKDDGALGPSLAFAPDAPLLAVDDLTDIRVWDVTDPGRPSETASTSSNTTEGISFSPDGRHVLLPGTTITLWDISSGETAPLSEGNLYSGGGVASFSPGADTVAATARLESSREPATDLHLWDADSPGEPRTLGELEIEGKRDSNLRHLAFHPRGDLLAGAGDDGAVRLWSIADRRRPYLAYTFSGHEDVVDDVVLGGPEGRTMLTSSAGSVYVWDLGDYPEIAADTIGMACRVAGGGLTAEEWDRRVPDAGFEKTCPKP